MRPKYVIAFIKELTFIYLILFRLIYRIYVLLKKSMFFVNN